MLAYAATNRPPTGTIVPVLTAQCVRQEYVTAIGPTLAFSDG